MAASFPSGHTNTGYTDASLLLAEMVPERFEALLQRGARYRLFHGWFWACTLSAFDVMGHRSWWRNTTLPVSERCRLSDVIQ
ncbi:hypothetical protein WDV93_20945 [Pantoea ananatis]